MLKNLKIGSKLTVCFAIILAGLLGVSVFGITSLKNISNDDAEMYNQNLKGVSIMGNITQDYYSLRVKVLQTVYMNFGAQAADDLAAALQSTKADIDKQIADYESAIVSADDKKNLDTLKPYISNYEAEVNKEVDLVKTGEQLGAQNEMTNVSSAATKVADQVSLMLKWNQNQGNQKQMSNASLGSFSTLLMIIIAAVVCVLAILLAVLVTRGITKPVRSMLKAAEKLAEGDVEVAVNINSKDEVGMLAQSFGKVVGTIKGLMAEMRYMSEQHDLGDIDVTIPDEKFQGAFKDVAGGINNMVKGHIADNKKAMACIDEFGRGNFEAPLEQFPGKKAFINDTIEQFRVNLKALITDANMLVEAAIEGKLSTRADASRHEGDFKKIVDGVNRTLDAVIEPISEAAIVLNELAKGNLDIQVAGDYKGDHADIKNALNDTIVSIKGYIGQISDVLAKMAGGDMAQEITSDYRGAFNNLKGSINAIIDSLNTMLMEINHSAEQVASGTKQVSNGSQTLAQGASEQSSSIEELTSSILQVASQTQQNATNASEANDLAIAAKNSAARGNAQMKNMLASMDAINESSNNISKIIKVIDDIAFQTNILALNAAVEAARAGIHGKGFAVVAEEVRNLAAKSADAAKETTNMIEGSIKKVEHGTKLANDTASALGEIVSNVDKAATLVADIADASNQQATAIAQINKGIEQVSAVVQSNSATAEESAAASEELTGQAEILKGLAGQFRLREGSAKLMETFESGYSLDAKGETDSSKY